MSSILIVSNREMDRRCQQLQHEQQTASRERCAAEKEANNCLISLLVGEAWLAAFTARMDQSLLE
jgi:hypothetical protein